MLDFSIPAFGETDFLQSMENPRTQITKICAADGELYAAYGRLLRENGFAAKEGRRTETHLYSAFRKESCGIFLNFYPEIGELYIVCEEDCAYFTYTDTSREASSVPQITQITLEDFGMSYAIRLSDGRFVVIDGGRKFEPDAERLFRCLKEGSPYEKPVIAAWIFTHPHTDHFYCFITFADRYGDQVEIEKFLFNFPEADDLAHYPKLTAQDPRFDYDTQPAHYIGMMWERIARSGAPAYTAHTGQTYRIGDAQCEILASMDDTLLTDSNINAASLVLRMELAGQVILWAADSAFSSVKMAQKHGAHLKADILQIPHHGFQSGTAEGEIAAYDLIRPHTCLLPVSAYNAFTVFSTYRAGTQYLMATLPEVQEVIPGTPQRTITLPYTPPVYAKKELEHTFLAGRDNAGARTWVFSDLFTGREEDFRFTLLNTTNFAVEVQIELFFESKKQQIRYIKAKLEAGALRIVNIIGEDVDSESLYFNWLSLKTQGIPENAPFAVRFLCDIPIVVSHSDHAASYRSSIL